MYKNIKLSIKDSIILLEMVDGIIAQYHNLEQRFSTPLPKIYKNFLLKYPEGIYKIKRTPIKIMVKKWSQKKCGFESNVQTLRCFFGLDKNDNVADWTDHIRGKFLTNPVTGKDREIIGNRFVPIGEFWNGDILLIHTNGITFGAVYLFDKQYWGGPGTKIKKEFLTFQSLDFKKFLHNIINTQDYEL